MEDRRRTGNEIALVGMAARFPGAATPGDFWTNLKEGRESLRSFTDDELEAAGVARDLLANPDYVKAGMPLDGVDQFDAGFFGISARDAAIMDPQHRHFLECVWEVFENAAYDPKTFDGAIGVFAGSGHNTYLPYNLLSNPALLHEVGYFLLRHTGNDKDFLSTGASYQFDLRGPSVNIQTACSTSLVAIHMATNSLLGFECDMAIAGGVTITVPHGQGHLFREHEILTSDGHCRPFDRDASGTIFGSGVGLVALRRLEDALADGDHIYALLLGSAVNNDGANKVSYLAPSVDGQIAVMTEALQMAEVDSGSIDYIECHGTGTRMGDSIEVAALKEAYETTSDNGLRIGSVKSNIGHLDTAAGVASVIKVALSMKHRALPPTLHFREANPELDLEPSGLKVVDRPLEWTADKPLRASVNSLGVGGTNAHLIMESAPEVSEPAPDRDVQIFPLSARSPQALLGRAEQLLQHLDEAESSLPDLAWTLQTGRRPFSVRAAIASTTAHGLRDELRTLIERGSANSSLEAAHVAMMFSGGGAAHIGMGRGLYEHEAAYRSIVDQCCEAAEDSLGYDLKALLLDTEVGRVEDLERPTLGLPSLFVTQYACAKLWESMGVQPVAVIGHSVGEYAAACVAGIMSVEDGLKMVIRRAQLFEQLPEGGMLSVVGPSHALERHLTGAACIAVHNAPDLSVVSGPVADIERLESELPASGFEVQRVPIRVAAHSSMLEQILPEFRRSLGSVALHPPRIPLVSNLSGDWLSPELACDPDYWVRQLREPVLFAQGAAALAEKANVLLEAGPGRVLSSLVKAQPFFDGSYRSIASMRHANDTEVEDRSLFYQAAGDLWTTGITLDWANVHDDGPRRRVPLPTYPFDHDRYWVDASLPDDSAPHRRLDVEKWFHQPVWEPRPDPVPVGEGPFGVVVIGELPSTVDASLARVAEVRRVEDASPDGLQDALTELPQSRKWLLVSAMDWKDSSARTLNEVVLKLHEQAVAVGDSGAPLVGWRILVHDLARVPPEDEPDPIATALTAAARVVDSELDVSVRCIDLGDEAGTDSLFASLVERDSRPLALRGPFRYVLEHRPLDISDQVPEPPKGGGCCVITGGLGDLALEFAKSLSGAGWGRFALISRRGLPGSDDQEFFESEGGSMARRMIAVEELREGGAAVRVWTADIADPNRMATVWREIETELGPVELVLHAAGTLDDGLIGTKTTSEIERVLAPKAATQWLVEHAGAPLVLFSSTSSVAGLPGQFAYAAGNGYLDGHAQRAPASGGAVLSLGWGAWKDTGMAARFAGVTRPVRNAPTGGSRRRGRIYERVITGSEWVVADHRTRAGTTLMPGTGLIALIAAASEELPFALAGVTLLQPLVLRREDRVVASVAVDDDRLTIRSAESAEAAEAGDWCGEHVEAELSRIDAERSRLDVEALRTRCTAKESLVDRHPRHPHMRFGPRWTCLDGVRYGDGEAMIEASLEPGFADDLSEWSLHPAMLDVATGAAQKLLPDFDSADYFWVPQGYGRLCVYEAMRSSVVSHVRLMESSDDSCVLDIVIARPDGDVIVEVSGFRLRRMHSSVMDEIEVSSSSQTHGKAIDQTLADAIHLDEGLPLLTRLLTSVRSGHVIVSPIPLDQLQSRAKAVATVPGATASPIGKAERPSLSTEYVAPKNDRESAIALAWQEVLGFSKVGTDDNFFALGGHSLLLTKIVSRLRKEVGLKAPLSELFAAPTIGHWAASADAVGSAEPAGRPLARVSRAEYVVSEDAV